MEEQNNNGADTTNKTHVTLQKPERSRASPLAFLIDHLPFLSKLPNVTQGTATTVTVLEKNFADRLDQMILNVNDYIAAVASTVIRGASHKHGRSVVPNRTVVLDSRDWIELRQ